MKTNFKIVLALAISIQCSAQHTATKYFKRHLNSSDNERSVVEYLKAVTNKNFDQFSNAYNISDTTLYVRDANGNVTQSNTYYPNMSNNVFDLTMQTNTTYNSSNNILSEINLDNGFMPGNPLENNYKRENIYDANQNLIESKDYTWVNNAWQPQTKTISSYLNNNLNSEISLNWVDSISAYVNSYESSFTYNSFNQIISVLGEAFLNGSFINDFKITNVTWPNNTEQDMPQSYTSQYWDNGNNTWINQQQYNSNIDGFGNLIQEEEKNWDGNNWIINSRSNYTYNSNNDKTSEIARVDTSSNLLGQLGIQRNQRLYYNSGFVLTTDTIDTFDFFFGQVFPSTVAHLYKFNNNKNMLTDTAFYLNQGSNIFERTTLKKNYYALNTSSIKTNEQDEISIFPNPVSNYLTISLKGLNNSVIELFDYSGKIISSFKSINMVATIDVSNLPKGIYFVKTTTMNDVLITKKFVKL